MAMVRDDLAWYVQHLREERYLEYKAAMSWTDDDTKVKLAKAIVAMSNIGGGGVIVIGIREVNRGVWELEGLVDDIRSSFNQDDVAVWVNNHFTPATQFSIESVMLEEKTFLLIQIQEFERIPLICRTPFTVHGDVVLRPSAMYYRSK